MKKHILISALFTVCILMPSSCGPQQGTIDTTDFSSTLEQSWKESGVRAIGFGFVTAGGQIWTETFGPAIWSGEAPLTADHIFRIASMTKAITSVAAMQLVERGLLGLDDPIANYLPEIEDIPVLAEDGSLFEGQVPITLRHLLTHTAGFGYAFMNDRLRAFEQAEGWPYNDMPRVHEAGEAWTYGTNTDWAGYLVETVSGMDLETYFRTNITGPLGMNHTWFEVPDSLKGYMVSIGMRQSDGAGDIVELPDPGPLRSAFGFNGGAGLNSSLNDYLHFLACMINGGEIDGVRILEDKTVASLFEDQLPVVMGDRAGDFRHGLAWAIEGADNDYGRREGSGYWSGIYNTYFSLDINTGIAVVVMTNFLPFGDDESIGLYKQFESMVRTDQQHNKN